MKKIVILLSVALFVLASCGNNPKKTTEEATPATDSTAVAADSTATPTDSTAVVQ